MEFIMKTRMLYREADTYVLIVHKERVLYLPSVRRTKVDIENNWLYTRYAPPIEESEEEDFIEFETNIAGDVMNGDIDA